MAITLKPEGVTPLEPVEGPNDPMRFAVPAGQGGASGQDFTTTAPIPAAAIPAPTAAPSDAASQIAVEAQKRLGLSFTPDLNDPDMKAAVLKALDTITPAQPTAQPEPVAQPTPTPVTSPAQVTQDMLASKAKTQDADNEDMTAVVKNYDPNATYDPTSKMDNWSAFQIGRQMGMKNWADVDKQFKQIYPQGDLLSIGGNPLKTDTGTWLYRESPDQPFKPLETASSGGGAAAVGEQVNARNAANIASTAISPEVGAYRAAGITGLATATGDYLDYLSERAQGFAQGIDPSSETQRALTTSSEAALPMYGLAIGAKLLPPVAKYALQLGQGIKSLAGGNVADAASSVVPAGSAGAIKSKGISILSKLASPTMLDLSDRAVQAGLAPLTLGQVGPSMVQNMAAQASGTSGKMKDTVTNAMSLVRQKLQAAIAGNPDAAANPVILQKMADAQRDELLAAIPTGKLGQSVSGLNLQSGLQAWRQNSRVIVRNLGDDAATKAGDTWIGMPMQPLQDAAKDVRVGVQAPGKEPGTSVQIEPPTKLIQPYLTMIDGIGDRLGTITDKEGNEHNAFDQFIALRDGLYDLKNEGPDAATRQQAYTLWQATQKMADQASSEINGKTGRQSTQAFKDAYGKFIDTYKSTEDTADTLTTILNSRDPGTIARALTQPGRLKTLMTIKNALVGTPQEGAWNAIQDGFRSLLQEDLGKAGDKIANLRARDPEMLDQLISKREQMSWSDLSQAENDARASLSGKLGASPNSPSENAIALAQKASKAELAKYTAATGGPTGDFATAVRSGIWQDILQQATKVEEKTGEESISPQALNSAIRKYMIGTRRDALDSVMTQGDWDTLALMRQYSAVVGASVNTISGGLQAGQLASHLSDIHGMIFNRDRFFLSMLKTFNNRFVSDILATPVGQQAFAAAAKAPTIPSALAILSHVAGHAASFYTQDKLHPQREQPTHIQGEGQ